MASVDGSAGDDELRWCKAFNVAGEMDSLLDGIGADASKAVVEEVATKALEATTIF